MPTPDQVPHDLSSFVMWALCVVCAALAGLAIAVIKWSVSQLEARETQFKAERKEDQRDFLSALTSLTAQIKEMNKTLDAHVTEMRDKHAIEVGTIAKLAGESAVDKYISQQERTHH